jgi:hypothetical protein
MCPLCDDGTCSDWKLYENCLYARVRDFFNYVFYFLKLIFLTGNIQLSFIIDNPSTVFFSVFMSVWSVILIDLWRRKQSRLHFEWDTPINDKFYENIRYLLYHVLFGIGKKYFQNFNFINGNIHFVLCLLVK